MAGNGFKLRLCGLELDSLPGKREQRLEQQFAVDRVRSGVCRQRNASCGELVAAQAIEKLVKKNRGWDHRMR